MEKIKLSEKHIEARKKRHGFSLRYDVFGSILHQTMSQDDYFDFVHSYPDEATRILLDGMYSGDWYSVYESEIIPQRKNAFLNRLREGGTDIFTEHLARFRSRGKECWIVHRISEVDIDKNENPYTVYDEHPDWFIPAFGRKMINMSSPEIREHKLRLLRELILKYPFDGINIDFERHTPILPPGRQWEMRDTVTDFMRRLRLMTLEIAQNEGRVIMLSARIPDSLDGANSDGLDVKRWLEEDLVDSLTLGSRSFDVRAEEFRALSEDISIYGNYDPHHTVDGYTFPPLPLIHGVIDSFRTRGADGVEYFNWSGEGRAALAEAYVLKYGLDPVRHAFYHRANDRFEGIADADFLHRADKIYPVDRRGGYPWGIGYGNLNATSPLPLSAADTAEVKIYVSDNIASYREASLRAVFTSIPHPVSIFLNGKQLDFRLEAITDNQITTADEAPISGNDVMKTLLLDTAPHTPVTALVADLGGFECTSGYLTFAIRTDGSFKLEKLEISVKGKK